ncbi:serine O-acetyltransferase [Azoarcus indigens]|uniref:Serine acetyltransferase n=1 Tax=Azoarcus indigens TaxID=29545 RepID=A0A4R6E670_9RHOO|nr:serine O-acetyltransferase [Azoarcus indigens]NMG65433.1 serine O-acetyltransferase [Azoarcus indigens]TDN53405.1 serine O-acetyltransferase [Azoarcus indigens]
MNTKSAAMTGETAEPGLFALLREDVRCVFGRDPAARTAWEVLTTYPGVHAVMSHRIAHALWRRGWRYPARLVSFLARVFTNVDIHPGARIGRRFFIDHGAGVVVGETAEIGDDVTLYHGVTLGGTTWNPGKRHPTLGDHVVVGAGAKILGAITIGPRVRVGANSVVVKNVPADRTVVGIPARVVRREAPILAATDELNLDHHLLPDPVGHTLNCLVDRIKSLESELAGLRAAAAAPAAHAVVPLLAQGAIDCNANTDGACPTCACQPETAEVK